MLANIPSKGTSPGLMLISESIFKEELSGTDSGNDIESALESSLSRCLVSTSSCGSLRVNNHFPS